MGGSSSLTCEDSRGGMFNSSLSTTWNTIGTYNMGIEANLGYGDDTAAYGLDTLGLDLSNATGAPSLDTQIVATFANNDYYLGLFGLSDQPTNFTNFTTPHPSFLASLRSQNIIPSLSWGYTAGAHYRKSSHLSYANFILVSYSNGYNIILMPFQNPRKGCLHP